MANFNTELQKLMAGSAPAGGFGLENLEGLLANLRKDFALGSRRASAQDQFQLGRRGLGNSVAGAFSQGRRSQQGIEAMLRQMMALRGQDKKLKNQGHMALLSALAPIANQNANRPSFLSSLLGGLGGGALKLGGAYLGAGGGLGSILGGGKRFD